MLKQSLPLSTRARLHGGAVGRDGRAQHVQVRVHRARRRRHGHSLHLLHARQRVAKRGLRAPTLAWTLAPRASRHETAKAVSGEAGASG